MINRILKNEIGLFLLAFVLLAGCDSGQSGVNQNHWNAFGLKGQVREIKELTWRAVADSSGRWVKSAQNQTYNLKIFDAEGLMLTESTFYTDSDEFQKGFKYVYSDQNEVIRVESLDPTGQLMSYSDIEKREGRVGIQAYTDYYKEGAQDKVISRTELVWQNNQILNTSTYDPENHLISATAYGYTTDGDVATFTIKNFNGQADVTMQATYQTYDSQGNWTQQTKEYPGFNIVEISERIYEYWE